MSYSSIKDEVHHCRYGSLRRCRDRLSPGERVRRCPLPDRSVADLFCSSNVTETSDRLAVRGANVNETSDGLAVRGGPSDGWVNGTWSPPSKREDAEAEKVEVEVEKGQAYSAGDYYAAPTSTPEATSAFPTDTSEVSTTAEALAAAMTDIAGKHVKNGAATMASAGGMMLSLAAVASSIYFF